MSRRPHPLALILTFALGALITSTSAYSDATDDAAPLIARLPAKAVLRVTTRAFAKGGDIPFENTQYRENRFPGLAWRAGPAGTKTYAVVMQDPDYLLNKAPVLHWVLFNIPADVTSLPAGMVTPPAGASYGPNYKGEAQPYLGPRTPPGPKHHYHFQVFALDVDVPAGAAASFEVLVSTLREHVLASGEVIGLGRAEPSAPAR